MVSRGGGGKLVKKKWYDDNNFAILPGHSQEKDLFNNYLKQFAYAKGGGGGRGGCGFCVIKKKKNLLCALFTFARFIFG